MGFSGTRSRQGESQKADGKTCPCREAPAHGIPPVVSQRLYEDGRGAGMGARGKFCDTDPFTLRHGHRMIARTIALLLLAPAAAGAESPAPAPAPAPPPAPAAAEGAPAAAPATPTVERTFRPNWEFEVLLGDKPVPQAVCYNTGGVAGMLILVPEIGRPLFARMADRKVLAVNPAGVRAEGESLVVAPSAYGEPVADWLTDEGSSRFTLAKKEWTVRERPIARGRLSLPDVLDSSPGFRAPMLAYTPDEESVKFLASYPRPVELRVFFGSWCHVCEQALPGLMRVLADAKNKNLHPVFMGMPREFKAEPTAVSAHVAKLPTLIVSVQGREVGRIEGRPSDSWEKDLWRMLAR